MLKLNFYLFFGMTFVCLVYGHSSVLKPERPIDKFSNIVKLYPKAEICGHQSDTKVWLDDSGQSFVSFKTDIKPNENTDDLCECMFSYVNQNNWLNNVKHKCIVDCHSLTLNVIGPSNPNHDPSAPVKDPKTPLAMLAGVIKYFPEADLAEHKCTSTSTLQTNGLIQLLVTCKLTPQSPCPDVVCKNVIAYLNQGHLLDKTKRNCHSKKSILYLEIIGK